MKKRLLLLAAVAALCIAPAWSEAGAASKKKKTGSRSDYTAEQRAKIGREAMASCRKRFGAGVVLRAQVDWKHKRYICYTN